MKILQEINNYVNDAHIFTCGHVSVIHFTYEMKAYRTNFYITVVDENEGSSPSFYEKTICIATFVFFDQKIWGNQFADFVFDGTAMFKQVKEESVIAEIVSFYVRILELDINDRGFQERMNGK